nr:hypothetical transcript [Hymenolepis microstoma]
MLFPLRLKKRLEVLLIPILLLFIFKDIISANYRENRHFVDILHEAKLHIFNSLAKFQVPFFGTNEENLIQGIEINIPLSCSANETHKSIFISSLPLLDVTVEENRLFANICLSIVGGKCQLNPKSPAKFCTSIHITRRFLRKTAPDDELPTCAFFQTCSFIINDRLLCGVHDFGSGIAWSTTRRLLKELNSSNAQWSADLYKGRVYPLWLLPCKEKCSTDAKCYWNEAELLRFSLKDNWNHEYLEGSGRPEKDYFDFGLGEVYSSSFSDSMLINLQRHMKNNSILFVGDSTLRGLIQSNGLTRPYLTVAFRFGLRIKVNKVIIKSHQAGFHIPNYVTHHFNLEYHLQKRRKTDKDMWRLGDRLKWRRLDDYHLTWSRLNHFIADFQCSCHFHRIRFNRATAEYEIEGEITEALLQDVYNLLNEEENRTL